MDKKSSNTLNRKENIVVINEKQPIDKLIKEYSCCKKTQLAMSSIFGVK